MNITINEQVDIMTAIQTQSRIIEAMLRANELEKQYRAQGYSEAQIQKFHEGVWDSAKEKWQKTKDWAKEKKDSAGKFIDNAGGVWGAIKKIASMFITWCKKVALRLINAFRSDENFIKKYEKLLNDNSDSLGDVTIRLAKVSKSGSYDDHLKQTQTQTKQRSFSDRVHGGIKDFWTDVETVTTTVKLPYTSKSAEEWKKMAEELKSTKVEYVDTTVKEAGGVGKLIQSFKELKSRSEFKEQIAAAEKVESEAPTKDTEDKEKADQAKAYLAFLKSHSTLQIKAHAAAHSALKHALIKCVAASSKKKADTEEKKEEVQKTAEAMIESAMIDLRYMYETCLSEGELVDQVIDSGIGTSNSMGITDVNLAGLDLGAGSSDPNKLVYDDDLYSQDTEMGDENIAGTVDIDPFDTTTHVASGNPTKAMESAFYEIIGMLSV